MYRNVSEVPSDAVCYQIVDDSTLIAYGPIPSDSLETFKLVSDKYIKATESTYTAPVDSSITCYTYTQIQELPSRYDFITPIYHLMAIASILFIVFCAYKLMIYPWFRKIS